jgi:hypothetical protein
MLHVLLQSGCEKGGGLFIGVAASALASSHLHVESDAFRRVLFQATIIDSPL